MWTLDAGYVVFPDGTRVRAISGGQEDFSSIVAQYDAGQLVQDMNADFYLTVGSEPLADLGGVPYGDPEASGYVGLSDFLRGGGDSEAYIASVNSFSLSDILRGGGESPGFDPTAYNPNPPGVVTEWNITSVIDSVTKGIATLGSVALGAVGLARQGSSGSSGTGQRAPSGTGQPSLAQRVFGMNASASGNLPQLLMWGALLAFGGFFIYTLARR